MSNWYMLTLVGKDRPGIVAKVTTALFKGGANLGEASMMRMGGNFTIMLMVQFDGGAEALGEVVMPESEALGLHIHIDGIAGELHQHLEPNVRVVVYGADRAGIVARVTTALAGAGLHILELESDVGGTADRPIYIMQIEGHAAQGILALQGVLDQVCKDGIEAHLVPIDTMYG